MFTSAFAHYAFGEEQASLRCTNTKTQDSRPHPQLQIAFVMSDWTRDASSPPAKATDASTMAT